MNKKQVYVWETNEYNRFKMLGGNRFVDHSDKIVESIKKHGRLVAPIIVNENFEIIDGQNRFEALKKLDMPVCYIVVPGYGINECIAMNSVSKNWTFMDYINSYASLGNENYKILLELIGKYKDKISTGVITTVVSGNIDYYDDKIIRNGTFTVGEDGAEYYDQVLNYLCQFDVKKIRGNNQRLYKIIAFCFKSKEIDNNRLLSAFIKHGYQIEAVVDTNHAAEAIEKIYNYHCKSTGYVFIKAMYQKYVLFKKNANLFTKKESQK